MDQLASAWWRTMRVRAIEADMLQLQVDVLEDKYKEKMGPIGDRKRREALAVRFVSEDPKDFQNFLRYDAAIERSFYRALNTLEKLQKERKAAESRAASTAAALTPTQNRARQQAAPTITVNAPASARRAACEGSTAVKNAADLVQVSESGIGLVSSVGKNEVSTRLQQPAVADLDGVAPSNRR